MYLSETIARKMICDIGKKMYSKNFVSANDGNITIRIADNVLLVTPTGISKGDLTESMLIKVDLDGRIIEGDYKPTSELSMHLQVYKENDAIQSTCHAHCPHLTALAVAGIELDVPTSAAASGLVGRIPVAPYQCPGSKELANSIIPYVKDYNIVNLGNHGPLSWGTDPMGAWYIMESAESACELAFNIKKYLDGKVRPLTIRQTEELFAFHHVKRSSAAWLTCPNTTDNQEPAVSFSSYFDIKLGIDNA